MNSKTNKKSKKSSFIRNIKGGECDEYHDIAKEYICPNPKGGSRKTRRSIDDLFGGSCDNGDLITKASINRACSPNDIPNDSQTAWSRRYNSIGGSGYSVMPDQSINGEPGIMRYTDSCRPIFTSKLTGAGKKSKKGIITDLAFHNSERKVISKNIKKVLKEVNKTKSCKKCSFKVYLGGSPIFGAVQEVGRMISPLTVNALAGMVSLLFMNEMMRKKKITSKKQLGGTIGDYVSMFVPLGKSSLIALASILLLNYYVVKKNSRKHKTHKGGNLIMADVGKLLAPLGVNAFGTSLVLLLLNRCISKKIVKKQQKGGSLQPLIGMIAPLGINTFIATGVLTLLGSMFRHKSIILKKKYNEDSLTDIRKDLKERLKPFMKK